MIRSKIGKDKGEEKAPLVDRALRCKSIRRNIVNEGKVVSAVQIKNDKTCFPQLFHKYRCYPLKPLIFLLI